MSIVREYSEYSEFPFWYGKLDIVFQSDPVLYICLMILEEIPDETDLKQMLYSEYSE